MAKRNRKELEARLKELKSSIKITEDHNIADLEIFVSYEEQKVVLGQPAMSLTKDVKTIEALEAKVKTLETDVEELNSELSTAELTAGNVISNPIGTYNKQKYEIIYPKLNVKGKVFTDQEIADDSKLIGELVKSNSSAVREVEQ
jgi:hypothetical protein